MRKAALVLAAWLVGCAGAEPEIAESTDDALVADQKIEIKMMVTEVDAGPALLGVDATDVELRDVTFYDTADLSLFEDGIILRTRRVAGESDDSTVKVRPLYGKRVDSRFHELDDFKCEYDKSIGKRAVSSCSLTTNQGPGEIVKAARGDQRIETLFTAEQLALLSGHAAVPDWSKIRAYGPIVAEVWKVQPAELEGTKVTVERWEVPGAARSLEVSIKVAAKDSRSAQRKFEGWVASRGMTPASEQQTKTKAALVALSQR